MGSRRVLSLVVLLIAFALAACTHHKKPVAAPPQPSAPVVTVDPASPSAAEPTIPGRPAITTNPDGTVNKGGGRPSTAPSVLTAGGVGPYQIGVTQAKLSDGGLLGKVAKASCPGYAKSSGVSKYRSPALVFYDGRLLHLTVTSSALPTDRGVKVGDPLTTAKAKYPSGLQLDDFNGRPAWFATVGDFGLLFLVDNAKVSAIQAGMAEPIRFKYTDNQGC